MTTRRPPVALIGGGTIGLGWAVVLTTAGHEVRLVEPDASRRATLREAHRERVALLARHGLATVTADDAAARLVLADDLAPALDHAGIVLECAPEDFALKRALFAELDAAAAADVVLASACSALTASRIADQLPGRALPRLSPAAAKRRRPGPRRRACP